MDVEIPADHAHILEYQALQASWDCWCGASMGDEDMPT